MLSHKLTVENDNGRDKSDTKSSDEASGNQKPEASGSGLKSNTDKEDDASSNNCETSSEEIGKITSDDGT